MVWRRPKCYSKPESSGSWPVCKIQKYHCASLQYAPATWHCPRLDTRQQCTADIQRLGIRRLRVGEQHWRPLSHSARLADPELLRRVSEPFLVISEPGKGRLYLLLSDIASEMLSLDRDSFLFSLASFTLLSSLLVLACWQGWVPAGQAPRHGSLNS
jgi:hypothetical protein